MFKQFHVLKAKLAIFGTQVVIKLKLTADIFYYEFYAPMPYIGKCLSVFHKSVL